LAEPSRAQEASVNGADRLCKYHREICGARRRAWRRAACGDADEAGAAVIGLTAKLRASA